MTLSKLDYRDRLRIEQMVRDGRSHSEIAKRIGVHYSTIWRELSRKGVWYEHDVYIMSRLFVINLQKDEQYLLVFYCDNCCTFHTQPVKLSHKGKFIP